MSNSKDAEMLARAKAEVNLPGWFASRGWIADPERDTARNRNLRGPDGEHVIVTRAADNHWTYYRTSDGRGGTIFDATAMFGGAFTRGQQYAACRRALASPNPAPPVVYAAKSQAISSAHCVPMGPLNDAGREYLCVKRHLSVTTIETFAHALRSGSELCVVARHNAKGGEERGDNHRRFGGGNSGDGASFGRSLWLAVASPNKQPVRLVIAESFIDALSAWELLPPELRPLTALASTGGTLCPASIAKLAKTLARVPGIEVFDASDKGEINTPRRTAQLRAITEAAGCTYHRLAPPNDAKDWNDVLAVQRTVRIAEAAALLPTVDEQEVYAL